MKRREFSAAAAGMLAAGALALPGLARAQRKAEEGRDYRELDRRATVEAPPGRIEVVEFFWYSCPHCNAFEPKLKAWLQRVPADVALRRVPVAFRESFVPQQRLYYTLEALGKIDELHGKVFEAIHGQQRQSLDRDEAIFAFAERNGLERAKFQELYNSFSVQSRARRAADLQDQYQVDGVPALGVAGRYYTDATMAGSMERSLQVVEYLIAEARKAK
jgi:thiol:disulfide interchange protein DsbA